MQASHAPQCSNRLKAEFFEKIAQQLIKASWSDYVTARVGNSGPEIVLTLVFCTMCRPTDILHNNISRAAHCQKTDIFINTHIFRV